MPVIDVVNLSKSFGKLTVLSDVNLAVEEGESLVILGGSGTGKTVLLRCIMGLLRPDSGHVAMDGRVIQTMTRDQLFEARKEIGMCFQMAALFDSMTVEQNVGFALKRHTSMTRAEILDRVDECLNLVGLKGTNRLRPSELSGGMKRRVGFARAIALKPKILLFDEPTTGLDPVMTDVIGRIIMDLKQELGVTSITITHDLKSAFAIADRIALLFRGKCLAVQKPDDFRVNPHEVIQQFLRGDADGPFLQDPPPPSKKPSQPEARP
ncbi:ABC transporter ATP-binding protein [Mesoterricola silvestris]|uniref:ABC transporter ATP-binding protein n=1 Tax=Mesoterricola silvestris TaxID=2927979 RepID=A0AA48GK55_9BACT|nr:ABC transporter ATP-binding protein [Mesoterricola silvestris]BDU72822.1 ABC transporter ATP-binding protein [Mesoterricola silvestris]